jgi:hypothetical protein
MLLNVPGLLCRSLVTGLVCLDLMRKIIENMVYLLIFALPTFLYDLYMYLKLVLFKIPVYIISIRTCPHGKKRTCSK